LIIYGYFKKVVVADNIAVLVDEAFQCITPVGHTFYWWFIMGLFALQIYCDFSGYTDIARGLGKWMGYDFAPNFQHPYIACSIREFWQRWHISLSTWFRDYVYIPLGGSRRGIINATLVMWITMLVSGFWHGASWTFLIWGGLHAMYLTLERLTLWPQKLAKIPGGRFISLFIVFILVLIAWIFFRAQTVHQALEILKILFSFDFRPLSEITRKYPLELFLFLLMTARHFFVFFGGEKRKIWRSRRWQKIEPFYFALLITICIYFRGPGKAFIYFQF
ncbi:MAG: MBOAT family O-acyltransferase, partial [Planctomycetota bacterium]